MSQDWHPAPSIRAVVKRDGREVHFERDRIVTAVQKAQEAAGDGDAHFAQEVADVVALTLATRCASPDPSTPPHTPSVEEIQDLVEQALIEMGRTPVAKAYILYRDRRSRAREAMTITDHGERRGRMPLVRAGGGTVPWDPSRIVAALMEEAELPREEAAEVAHRVEARVLDAGLRRLSTTLVRELVAGEMVAMGLENALRRHEPVGVPRHDLRQWLRRPRRADRRDAGPFAPAEPDLVAAAGREVLGRYALGDVLEERISDLHQGGALFVEDLGQPHRVLARSLPAQMCLRGEPHPHSGFELLGEVAGLLTSTARGLVLEDLHAVAAPMTRAARSTAGLRDLLAALGAVGASAARHLDLSAPGGRGGSFVARLLPELAALEGDGLRAPRLWLSWDELAPALEGEPLLSDAAEALLARGRLLPVWHGKHERWVAPGCRRRVREQGALACGGAVALNLPRLARQAGPWREELVHEALVSRVQHALDALERLRDFQRDHPAAQVADLRERTSYAITPVGLVEALRILADGEVRPEQGARLLGVLTDAAQRLGEERGLVVVVSSLFGERAALHMAAADARTQLSHQPRLFADLPAPEAEREQAYGTGVSLPGAQGGAGLARLLATSPSGAVAPRAPMGDETGERWPHLAAWRAFDEHRFADTRSAGRRPTRKRGETSPLFRS